MKKREASPRSALSQLGMARNPITQLSESGCSMAEHASKGRKRMPVRARGRGPEPARERSPEEVEVETKQRKATAEKTLGQVETAVRDASKAFGERDVEAFDNAKQHALSRLTQAQIYVLSFREHARDVAVATSEDASRQLAEVEAKSSALKREVDELVRPEPLPEPFAGEDLVLSSIPGGQVRNAHVAFGAAEARLVGLLKGLPGKDRGIFEARIRAADKTDPIAMRWQRLSAERRLRILKAVRSTRSLGSRVEPGPTMATHVASIIDSASKSLGAIHDGWRDLNQHEDQTVDEHERVQFEINNVDAEEWLFTNRDTLEDRVFQLMKYSTFSLSHGRLAWAGTGFADLLAADLLDGLFLERLAAVLPQTDLGALADRFRLLTEKQLGASKDDEPRNDQTDVGGPVGPRTWEPDFAIAVVRKLDAQVRASIHRLQPRIVAAADASWQDDKLTRDGFDPATLVFSHPVDRLVANAMASFGTLIISRAEEGSEIEAPSEIRPVQFRWLEEPPMWNWIEVQPADASVEEVSQALFGTTEKAYLLSPSAPFFEVPVKQATVLAPQRRFVIEARNLLKGTEEGASGVDALVSSNVAETAALAQASRAAKSAALDAASIDGSRMADVCLVELESLAERFGTLGVGVDFSAVLARLSGRRAALGTDGEPQVEKLGLLFAQQRVVLFRVGALLEKIGVVKGNETAKHLAERLSSVANVSDFAESARARLADIGAEVGALPNEIATRMLNEAMARFGGLERVLEATSTPIKLMNEEVTFGDLRGQYDKLRERALDVERRQAAGAIEPDEQRKLLDDVEFFETRVRTIHQVTQLTHTMEGLSGARGWAASIVGIHDDLGDDHVDLRLLREDIVRRFRNFAQERAMHLRKLGDPGWKPDPRTEYETTAAEVAKFKQELAALGADAKIKASIQRAYDTLDDASGRLALLEFAKFIGVALITSGAGAIATGVARGFQVGRLAVAGATVATEAVVSGALVAASSDEAFAATFATELVTGMAFFGAFKAFEQVWGASQVGRNVTAMKATGGVNRAAAVGVEFGAQGSLAVGLQAVTAEVQMRISEGRSLTGDELAQILAQGTAMHIGSTIGHKVATPVLARLESLGARGASLVVRARRVRALARRVEKAGSLDGSLELIAAAQDLAQAEAKLFRDEALSGRSPEDAPVSNPGSAEELAASARETGIAYQDLALEAIAAQSGLEQISGGLAGTTSEVAALVVKAEAAGLVPFQHVRADGSRVVTLEGETRSIEVRELDRPENAAERGENLETQIEVNRLLREPPPLQTHLDEFLGVSKTPENAKAQEELAGFFQDQDAQAKKKTRVLSGRQADGPYRWRYGADATTMDHGLVSVEYRVFLNPQGVATSNIPAFKARVVEGIDRFYNYRHEVVGRGGKPARLHLEVKFVDDPSSAHSTIVLKAGDGRADAAKWFEHGEPTTHAHEVGHSAFGLVDEYVDADSPQRADPSQPGVRTDDTVMGDYWLKDEFGKYLFDSEGRLVPNSNAGLKPRHLEQMSRLWNSSFGDRLRSVFGGGAAAKAKSPSSEESLRSKVETRIGEEEGGFELILEERALREVVAHGRSAGLDNETIEHIVFIGSRIAKRRTATQMIQEMTNYSAVRERGFPFRFRDEQDFGEFVSVATSAIGKIVPGTIRVQGSALRTPAAKDVDIAVIVGDPFDDLLVRSFQGDVRRKGEILELSVDGLEALANAIDEHPGEFNARARTFRHAYRKGKVRDKDVGLKPARLALTARWGKIDLSVVKSEAGFDLKPRMDLTTGDTSD